MKNLRIIVNILTIALFTLPLSAQTGAADGSRYGHGEDSIKCIKNLSLYREFIKHQNYDDAIGPWEIVYQECPLSSQNIYIDGAKMYNHYISVEQDPARREELIDKLMATYDQRIQYFEQRGSVLGRKAVDLLRYRRTDLESVYEGYGYLKESIKLLGKSSSLAVVATFMTSAFTLFENEKLSDIQVIQDYAICSEIIDYQYAKQPGDEMTNRVKESLDNSFIASGAPNCVSLVNYFTPLYESKKEDPAFLRKAISFLDALKCEGQPFYAMATEELYKLDPSPDAAFGLAKIFLKKEDYDKAAVYYEEAIDGETDPQKKADYLYQLAYLTNTKMQDPKTARNLAHQAIQLNPKWGDPYILIGDVYASSRSCFEDDFEQSTIYWAAVDKFQKAKDVDAEVSEKASERIETYSKYFPDAETIFFYSLKVGDNYTVGCWINENTTVRSR